MVNHATCRCFRCKRRIRVADAIDWVDGAGSLSPRFCAACYYWILDHWTEDKQVTEFEAGGTDLDG